MLRRDFLENNLVDFAKTNPGVVVYVKPRRHRSPVIVAEYCKCQRERWFQSNFSTQHFSSER